MTVSNRSSVATSPMLTGFFFKQVPSPPGDV